jgi:selenocysteine-specific elongation factor
MTTDLILGTAGHIDHGKTSLIRALTGVDTDRLPEEKKRGITIDLGFAELTLGEYRLGIVDVPGHERFVRNMLAGATGMDIAMLVIAADDSIKQQTREHLEILRLLHLEAGVIALTKCDLVEADWLELVEDEIRELVSTSFLAEAPIVRTAATKGQGLDALREKLAEAAERVAASDRMRRIGAPFRMAIDRTFTVAGHGTVVTGSISSGQVSVGDTLRIEPGGIEVRVRGLHNHDRTVDAVHRGQRAAINLAGVHHEQIQRGQELTSPGHLVPSRLLTVQLSLLQSDPRALKNRARIRVHLGTAELLASVRLLGRDRLEPGESAPAQLFLSEPAVSTWSQPFVARSESPVVTIGGGQVLDPNAEKIRKPDEEVLTRASDLRSPDPTTRASAALYFAGLRDWKPDELARTAGIENVDEAYRALLERRDLREITISPTRKIRLHRRVIDRLCDRIEAALKKMHELNPLRSMLDRSQLVSGFRYLGDETLIDAVLESMHAAGRINLSGKRVSLVGYGPKLSQNEQKLLLQLIERFRQAGLQPPSVKECRQQATKNQESVPQLIALAAAEGELVEIAPDFYLHAETERAARETLTAKLAAGQGLTMSEIRETLNTSRKFAVPLCEYFDRVGFTRREGDLRVLAERATS